MARPQESFGKKEKEKKRLKKREEKQRKKEERKSSAKSGDLEDMLVYVDENGQLTDTPPDPNKKKEKVDADSIVIGVPKKEYVEEDPFHKGKVEFFNDSKGFGFINDLDSQEKYFVHISELIDEVKEGDSVIFEIERGMKGMNAVRVKKG